MTFLNIRGLAKPVSTVDCKRIQSFYLECVMHTINVPNKFQSQFQKTIQV